MGGQRGREPAVLDGLDGRIARALKGTSRFGAELNSLADFVDFGVAPALVPYVADLHAAKNFAGSRHPVRHGLRTAARPIQCDDRRRSAGVAQDFFRRHAGACGRDLGLLPIYLHYAFDLGPPTRGPPCWKVSMSLEWPCCWRAGPALFWQVADRVPREDVAVVLVEVAAALLPCPIFDAGAGRRYLCASGLDPFAVRRYRRRPRGAIRIDIGPRYPLLR